MLAGLEPELLKSEVPVVTKFDLTLYLGEAGEEIVGGLEYATALFERPTIERYLGYFRTLLTAMVSDETQVVDRLPILPERERDQVLYGWNATAMDYPRDKCVHELFEEQVRKTPEATAVVFEETALSYEELNRRANRLGHYLRELGVKPDERVAICVERSVEMVVALLGVLKAGGAYVPLDPSYPVERLRYMLEDSEPLVLLTQGHLEEQFSDRPKALAVIDLANTVPVWKDRSETNPDRAGVGLRPEHLAYVIYTSGSTGRPKGVAIEHRGVCNLAEAQARVLEVDGDSHILQFASFSFDASVFEVVMTLCQGASLHLVRQDEVLAGDALIQAIRGNGISHVTLPPAILATMQEPASLDSVGVLVAAGEKLTDEVVRRWGTGRRLINAYGPTEVTVWAAWHECDSEGSGNPPIGRPIANTRIYILDEHGEPVPVGVTGELYIAGAGVARGYLNRRELTAERFLGDPFVGDDDARMYRTGDLGRWLPDGTIEFLGRNDDQVKIRGFRVELGEIEATLSEHPAIAQAAVIVRESQSDSPSLDAYVVPDEVHGLPLQQVLHLSDGDLPHSEFYKLPNGMSVSFQNKTETDSMYREIFEAESYLRNGITLDEGACVFDVGANIGLFTLFVGQRILATQYAFEPIPAIFENLRINTTIYQPQTRIFNCGLSSKSGEDVFTWYRHNSVMSGRYADSPEEHLTVKSVLQSEVAEQNMSSAALDELLDGRLEGELVTCELRTLSSIIVEEGIERIDLLKIDVEKSELDVLEGVRGDDWDKIHQIVIEVHDIEGRLARILHLLESHGFVVSIEQPDWLKATNISNIYARRSSSSEPVRESESASTKRANLV